MDAISKSSGLTSETEPAPARLGTCRMSRSYIVAEYVRLVGATMAGDSDLGDLFYDLLK